MDICKTLDPNSLLKEFSRDTFNIRCKSGLKRVKGYTAVIPCVEGRFSVDSRIGLHKDDKGFWTVTDLHSGLAITATDRYSTRKDALREFIRLYPRYSHIVSERYLKEVMGK